MLIARRLSMVILLVAFSSTAFANERRALEQQVQGYRQYFSSQPRPSTFVRYDKAIQLGFWRVQVGQATRIDGDHSTRQRIGTLRMTSNFGFSTQTKGPNGSLFNRIPKAELFFEGSGRGSHKLQESTIGLSSSGKSTLRGFRLLPWAAGLALHIKGRSKPFNVERLKQKASTMLDKVESLLRKNEVDKARNVLSNVEALHSMLDGSDLNPLPIGS